MFCLDPDELGLKLKEDDGQTCLTCEFEPELYKYDNGYFGECQWYYKTNIPTWGVNVYPRQIDKTFVCKNCQAWRPK